MENGTPTHPVLAAGVVLWSGPPQDPRFLLLRNSRHQTWAPPKGHLDAGETLYDTALREVREETGYRLGLESLRPDFADTTLYQERPGVWKRVVYFLAAAPSNPNALVRSPEHDDHLWLEIEAALRTLDFEETRRTLRRAANRLLPIPAAS